MKRLPPNGLKRVKLELRPPSEVPEAEWYLDFGDFIVCGDGIYLSTYLGPEEMAKVQGNDLRCWRNNKGDPKKLKKCWRNKSAVNKAGFKSPPRQPPAKAALVDE
jgi:hypothetical protein